MRVLGEVYVSCTSTARALTLHEAKLGFELLVPLHHLAERLELVEVGLPETMHVTVKRPTRAVQSPAAVGHAGAGRALITGKFIVRVC